LPPPGYAGRLRLSSRYYARIRFKTSPPYEKLVGDLAGAYSRRINLQHRLVYEVFEKERVVKVLRMWTHYQ